MSEQLNNQPQPLEEGAPAEPQAPELHPEEGSTVFVKREYTDKKPPRNTGTRRRALTLVACVLSLAVLAGAIFAVTRLLPQEEPADTSSQADLLGITLVDMNANDVQRIQLKNKNDSFTVFSEEVTSSSTSSATTTTLWKIDGIDPTLTTSSSISSFVGSCTKIEAIRKMNSVSGEFGFDDPTAVLTVTCTDSSKNYTLTVGKTSADSTGYYAKLSDDAVYIVNATYVTPLTAKSTEFANNKIFSALTSTKEPEYFSDGELLKFDYITFAGKNFSKPLKMEPNPEPVIGLSYLITQPIQRAAVDEPVQELLTVFTQDLTASGMFAYTMTPALKTQYGLDDPAVVMQAKIGDFEVKLSVGNLFEEYYALQLEGVNAIYKVSADALPFVTATERTYLNSRFFFEGIDTLSSIQFTGGGKDFIFNPSFDDKDELTVLYEGQKKSPTTFKVFYRNVLAMGVQDFISDTATGATAMTIKVKFNNGKADSVITFTEYSNRMCLVTVDGVAFGTIPKSQVTSILEYAQNVVDGKEVPEPALG